MDVFVKNLLEHNDIVIHVAGWSLTLFITGSTILYKGIWKRINQIDEEQTQDRENLNRLIGAHNATHGNGAIIERRADPKRVTVKGYENEQA